MVGSRIIKYRNTALAVLCVISWFVLVVRIFTKTTDIDAIFYLQGTILGTFATGITGGVLFIFLDLLRKKRFRVHFFFHLFATLNLLLGIVGMLLPKGEGQPTPYFVSGAFCLGLVMFVMIYSKAE